MKKDFQSGVHPSGKPPMGKPSLFERIEKQHPFLTLLYLAMIGSGLIFLFLLVGFTNSLGRFDTDLFVFPKFFLASTLVILVSSYFAEKAWTNFLNDEPQLLRQHLIYLLLLGSIFCISQFVGWNELLRQGIVFSGKAAGTYMYLLTGLHILHLAGGLAFAGVQTLHYKKACEDGVQALIIFSSKYEKTKMQLLKNYWHFLDILWLIIFVYLLLAL
ncbi:MAG: cytochrome C oxidase subunit III [Cytophagales bacterium]|nr:MAG: cytochrome C oxidase subunit III [Cytophagales bacterium]